MPNTCVRRNDCHYKDYEKTGHFKNSSSRTKFCVSTVPGAEVRWDCPTHIQPQSVKSLRKSQTISFDKYVSHPKLPSTQRLDVQSRPLPGIFSFENNKRTQAVSTCHLRSEVAGNDLSPIRSKHSSKNLFYPNQLDCSSAKRKMEHENCSVFRRFFDCTSRCRHTTHPYQTSSPNVTKNGVASKLQKIYSMSPKESSLLRNRVATLGQSKIPTRRKDYQDNQNSKADSLSKSDNSKRTSKINGIIKLCKFCSPKRSSQSPPTLDVYAVTTRSPIDKLQTTTECFARTKLVDSEMSAINSTALSSANDILSHRCLGSGLGSATEQYNSVRHLVARGAIASLQSEGDVSHIICTAETRSITEPQLNPHTMRQQNCSRLFTERRRDEIGSFDENNQQNFESSGRTSDKPQYSSYPGQVQQSCRPLIASSQTTGVASSSGLPANHILENGDSNDRSVRISLGSRSPQLCNTGSERPSCHVLRCVQCSMALPPSLGISTSISDPQSANTLNPVDRNISSGSTTMGEGLLACRPESPSTRGPVNLDEPEEVSSRHINGAPTTASREYRPRGLEMWGWTEATKEWNSDQLSLLKNSWRTSTLKTYEVAWRRWLVWSEKYEVDPKNPTGSQLAQFLSDLHLIHNLSYNTIILHKSVVATLCNADKSSSLSSHVLVKHILKSIALKKSKPSKPPVWNVDKLTAFLRNYTLNDKNLFHVSRHSAVLLLLCSGRRIHDLTLLQIDPNHCIRCDESIIFWPQFGSKTDCSNYRQSGWKLFSNPNDRKLNPVFWLEKLITLLNERRNAAKSFNLFVTLRGEAKPASRTVIASWVKTLFKEAEIEATPGSVRSAVASKSWLENHPLDEILARGNWRSVNTFRQFYKREVLKNSKPNNVTRLFIPID